MHKRSTSELLSFDPKIEIILFKLKRLRQIVSEWKTRIVIDTMRVIQIRIKYLECKNQH